MINRVLISGGGTGGHIYPAISIADQIKSRYPKAEFLFVGAKDRMEMQKVPQAGYKIKGLWISGVQRSLTAKNISFPFKLISSLWKAYWLVRKFKPEIVIGTGGFASGPVLYVASKLGIPCIIQEQNSYPGITNKLLAGSVEKIAVAYDDMHRFFPKEKIMKTGNPVRADLLDLSEANLEDYADLGLSSDKKTLLVIGGSLGARRVNQLIAEKLDLFKELGLQLIWQCGSLYYEEYKKYQDESVKVMAFINDMPQVYRLADFIISRAGASSVSELEVVGKAVLFIPSPNVAEDHQSKNAQAIVDKNAALMLREKDLDQFDTEFKALVKDPELAGQLGKNIKKLELTHASELIVDKIEELI